MMGEQAGDVANGTGRHVEPLCQDISRAATGASLRFKTPSCYDHLAIICTTYFQNNGVDNGKVHVNGHQKGMHNVTSSCSVWAPGHCDSESLSLSFRPRAGSRQHTNHMTAYNNSNKEVVPLKY